MGYFSEENVSYADGKGYSLVIMMKGCRKLMASAIDEVYGTFEKDRRCYIPQYSLHWTTVRRKVFPSDTKERLVHVYCGTGRTDAESSKLNSRLGKLSAYLTSVIGRQLTPTDEMKGGTTRCSSARTRADLVRGGHRGDKRRPQALRLLLHSDHRRDEREGRPAALQEQGIVREAVPG